jgi:hypothetical protein
VTTPTGSVALERFILNRAEESTHSAMLVRFPPSPLGPPSSSADPSTPWSSDVLVHASGSVRPRSKPSIEPGMLPHLSTDPPPMPRNHLRRSPSSLSPNLSFPLRQRLLPLVLSRRKGARFDAEPARWRQEARPGSHRSCHGRHGSRPRERTWNRWAGGDGGEGRYRAREG